MSTIHQDETLLTNKIGFAECRTCLQVLDTKSVLVDLFQCWVPPWDGMESTIAEDLAKLANVQITLTDRYSKVICEPCCLKLQSACDFACTVRKNHRVLKQRYSAAFHESNKTLWPKPIQLDKNINVLFPYDNVMDVEIKQEVLSEDEYPCNNGIEEEMKEDKESELANLEIKIEPEELLMPIQVVQPEELLVSMQAEQPEETVIEDAKPTQATLNGHVLPDMKEEDVQKLPNGFVSEKNILDIKEEPISDEEDRESISTELSLQCILCSKEFQSVSGLKAHVIAQHSYKNVKRKRANSNSPVKRPKSRDFVCETCQRRFTTSTDLMVHETCHNKSVCYACSAKFDTFEQLTSHSRRCKAIAKKELLKPKTLEDVKRTLSQNYKQVDGLDIRRKELKCSICNAEFVDKYYFKIHKETHLSVSGEQVNCKGIKIDIGHDRSKE